MIDFQMFQSIASNVASIRSMLRSARAACQDKAVTRTLTDADALVAHINDLAILAQADALSSQAECARLRQRLLELESWDLTAQRYTLIQVNPGQFVYHCQMAYEQPAHYACAVCFNKQIKSVLQADQTHQGSRRFSCTRCAFHVWINHDEIHLNAGSALPHPATQTKQQRAGAQPDQARKMDVQ